MRAFIAVEISDEVRKNITKIEKAMEEELPSDKIKIVDPQLIHITLKFLGEIDESKVEGIKEALSSIKFSPITLKCKGVGVFPNEKFIRVIWVGIEEDNELHRLKKIADEVEEKMGALGFGKSDYPFSPHITIGRAKAKVEIANFLRKYKDTDFGKFTVDEIKLKKSTLTQKGPIYEDV